MSGESTYVDHEDVINYVLKNRILVTNGAVRKPFQKKYRYTVQSMSFCINGMVYDLEDPDLYLDSYRLSDSIITVIKLHNSMLFNRSELTGFTFLSHQALDLEMFIDRYLLTGKKMANVNNIIIDIRLVLICQPSMWQTRHSNFIAKIIRTIRIKSHNINRNVQNLVDGYSVDKLSEKYGFKCHGKKEIILATFRL